MSGYVYMVSNGQRAVKIGSSVSIERRLKELQTGSPNKLSLISSIEFEDIKEAAAAERRLHESCSRFRLEGEWFQHVHQVDVAFDHESLKLPVVKPKNIYLAGKVGKDCWRHAIVDGLRGGESIGEETTQWPVMDGAIFGRHNFTGPFFVSCDHGCSHRPDHHGRARGCGGGVRIDESSLGRPHDRSDFRSGTIRFCLDAIRRSDLVFAWIDSVTCYGTLFELGYAVANRKNVVISTNLDYDIDDFWFATCASSRFIRGRTAQGALLQFLMEESPVLQRLRRMQTEEACNHILVGETGQNRHGQEFQRCLLCEGWIAQ